MVYFGAFHLTYSTFLSGSHGIAMFISHMLQDPLLMQLDELYAERRYSQAYAILTICNMLRLICLVGLIFNPNKINKFSILLTTLFVIPFPYRCYIFLYKNSFAIDSTKVFIMSSPEIISLHKEGYVQLLLLSSINMYIHLLFMFIFLLYYYNIHCCTKPYDNINICSIPFIILYISTFFIDNYIVIKTIILGQIFNPATTSGINTISEYIANYCSLNLVLFALSFIFISCFIFTIYIIVIIFTDNFNRYKRKR